MKRKIITIDLRELSDEFSRRDYVYIFYNEYSMHALNGEKSYELKVFTYGDDDIKKLERALKKYGADKDYIKSIKESKIENKFNDTKMKKKFVNESASANAAFAKAFITVASNNDDEDLKDADYLFGDEYHYIDDIIDEIEERSGIKYNSEDDFYADVVANAEDLVENPKARLLYNSIAEYDDMNEYPTFSEEKEEVEEDNNDIQEVVQDAFDNGEITTEDDLEDKLDELVDRINPNADELSDDEYNELIDDIRYAWKNVNRDSDSYEDFEEDEDFISHKNRKESDKEMRSFSKYDTYDEGFVYAKIDDVINEAREEGKREALREMRNERGAAKVYEAKTEVPLKIRKEDLKIAKQAFADKAKELKSLIKSNRFNGLVKCGEDFDAKALSAAYAEYFRGDGKYLADLKPAVMDIIKELKKLNTSICVISAAIGEPKEKAKGAVTESVTSKFSKFRDEFKALNESEDEKEETSSEETEEKDTKDSEKSKKEVDNDTEKEEDTEEEEIEIPAVVITVKKDAVDKCKEDMIEAGVEEDDIEVLEPEDEDAEEVEIKVDTNSILALKDYLADKGIDLEEKLGVTIESDDEEDSEKDDKEEKDSDDDDDSFDDLDDDFFANLGNIGEDDEKEEKE